MIDAKQIPDEVVEALRWALFGDKLFLPEALAAALNAWPNGIKGNSLFDGEPTLFLPLPVERNGNEG